jgi:hypothetical protein
MNSSSHSRRSVSHILGESFTSKQNWYWSIYLQCLAVQKWKHRIPLLLLAGSDHENREWQTVRIWFLASFLEYAIVRTSSVCLSVCLSVGRIITFHWVARLGRFMSQSIAYGLRILIKEGIFFLGRSWTWWEGSEVQFPLYFMWK